MKTIARRLSKFLILCSLLSITAPAVYSHSYWSDEDEWMSENPCDDAHTSRDDSRNKEARHRSVGSSWKCFDIREGTYKVYRGGNNEVWKECPKGRYCPGGSAGRVKPDEYSIAPHEGMSQSIACPTNQISDRKRLTCTYPQKLSEWDRLLDTKPKGSKYKDGKLVCKKGKNYSKQKGQCR